jgi:signal transduction histidine kinase
MRRLSLSSKLFVAALPLLIALGALLALNVRDSMTAVDQARRGAELGSIWEPLIESIRAVEFEQAVSAGNDPTAIRDARRSTSTAMAGMNSVTQQLDDSAPLTVQLGKVLASISTARNATDNPNVGYTYVATADDFFDAAESDLVSLGYLLPVEAGDRDLGRQLTAVAALAQVEQTGSRLVQLVNSTLNANPTPVELERARTTSNELADAIGTFQATAPAAWLDDFRASNLQRDVNDARRTIDQLINVDRETATAPSRIDLRPLTATMANVAEFRDARAADIVVESDAAAEELRSETLLRALIIGVAVLLAGVLALIITRSITRRVRTVSKRAQEVSTVQLPALVEALRDPRSGGSLPDVEPIDARGTDELAELAGSFNAVQSTLVEVANEQVEVLRRGVSDIFVTMARRNRSLVDRQLALLDELESEEHDHETLSNYFQLDHLATRMRRNSESLLVLANAESRRRRAKATEIDDVVRAAIGEVEDYRRIDVMHLDSLQIRGSAVAELSHLIAELLDNATAFSPPDRRVKVTGRFAGEEYLVRIIDEGVGVVPERLDELNRLLRTPPIIGLSVEPTLGMSVVSLLAAKHGVKVVLAEGAPGLIVDILLPSTIYGPIDNFSETTPGPEAAGSGAGTADTIAFDPAAAAPMLVGDGDGAGSNGHSGAGDHLPMRIPAPMSQREAEQADELLRSAFEHSGPEGAGESPAADSGPGLRVDLPQNPPAADATAAPGDTERAGTGTGTGTAPASGSIPGDPLLAEPELPRRVTKDPNRATAAADDIVASTADPVSQSADTRPVPSTTSADELGFDLDSFDIEPAWTHDDRDRTGHDANQPTPAAHPETEPVVANHDSNATDDSIATTDVGHLEPAVAATPATQPLLPPPTSRPVTGEFNRPPAPPAFSADRELHPVPNPNALPLPHRRPDPNRSPSGAHEPLPTRTRTAGTGSTSSDTGRTVEPSVVAPTTSPSALQSALSAFEAGRAAVQTPSLPTRTPGSNATDALHGAPDLDVHADAAPASITASRLDPEIIRARLRSFQSEHRVGRSEPTDPATQPHPGHGPDHGGDR